MYTQTYRKRALNLRKQGKSLKEISTTLKIAKSTASLWLTGHANKGAFGTMNRSEWMAKIRIKSLEIRRNNSRKRQIEIEKMPKQKS